KVLTEYANQDGRILLQRNTTNLGLGHSLNIGVNKAESKWIARMDADDVSMPTRLERQLEIVSRYPRLGVLGSWAQDIDATGAFTRIRSVPTDQESISRLIWTNPFIHSSVLLNRQ